MERITIKKFGPVKDIEFTLDRQYNVVIGEQATGKSTLAKCIYFFKDVISEMENLIVRQPEKIIHSNANEILNMYYNQATNLFLASFGNYNEIQNYEINFFYDTGKIAYIKKISNKLLFCYDSVTESDIKDIIQENLINVEEKTLNNMSFCAWRINALFGSYTARMFIPACRRRVTSGIGDSFSWRSTRSTDIYLNGMIDSITQYRFFSETFNEKKAVESYYLKKVFLNDLNIRFSEMKNLKKTILKGEYQADNKEGKTWIKLNNNSLIPVEYGSSGQQESLWILNFLTMIMYSASSRFLIIEEPEAHLYPKAQFELVKLIALVANTTGSQIMITTHSPYILSAFNLLTYAGKVEKDQAEGLIAASQRIAPQKLGAFKLEKGICRDIYDEAEGLISSEEIDTASVEMNTLFDKLIDEECNEMR